MKKREYADCYFCGGQVQEKQVDVIRHWNGRVIMIEDVPAGVCNQCGERYYWGDVAEEMDRIMHVAEKELQVKRELRVPVVTLAAT
ncbi:MAG TPA: type II toxin-antitoxin system MqsA family antitoxin [Thermoflexia bacterium]|nr:type II toxin-antitoxin system MqsA family antitoxin [Thermoflexia bacterium]